MHFNVVFSDEANDTFESIGEQIRAKWGDNEVYEFRKRVYKVAEIISNFPMIFQGVSNTENIRKAFIHKNCSMFYRVDNTYIEVLFFWDNRQDPIFL
ncbi:MAG TPA: type II toxin-antitoxin system RelE/ParE family toxin [Mucilaginibacter sp.]|jgi:plasmid stabilization system protein ParE